MTETFQPTNLNETNFWHHGLFEVLTQPQLQWLAERIEIKSVPVRASIFEPGDQATELYFVLQGKVKIEVLTGKKNWLIRDVLNQYDFFGLNGILGQEARREYARTLRTASKVMVIENSDLQILMEVNFGFSKKIMELAANKTKQMEQRISAVFEKSALTRFTDFLANMLEKEGRFDGKDWLLNSQLTQEEIGAYIGTGRQTVTEILNDLKSKKILTYNWGRFTIHEIEKLRN